MNWIWRLRSADFTLIQRRLRVCVGLWLASATTFAQPKDLGPILSPIREDLKIPGMAAVAMRDGEVLAAGAIGLRELNKPDSVTIDDLTMIGSCGKSATRLLIGRLVDQKRLKFESTLGELLPAIKMRDEYRGVTVAQLLAHRGGIPPYTEIRPGYNDIVMKLQGPPRMQRVKLMEHVLGEQEPVAKPGERFVYSNAGYALLGHIAETLLDTTFEELIHKQVFAPLDMRSARVGVPGGEPKGPHLTGHRRTPHGYVPLGDSGGGIPVMAPAGMMSCSARDFVKLAAMLAACENGGETKFLTSDSANKIKESRPGGPGEGVVFLGGEGSYTAGFATWPSKKLAIIVVTNAGDCDAGCERGIEAVRAAIAPDAAVSPSNAAIAVDPGRPRYGFSVQAENDNWSIANVMEDSPAAKAGLKAGDRIVSIGGKAPRDIEEGKLGDLLRVAPLKIVVERDGKELVIRMERPEATK